MPWIKQGRIFHLEEAPNRSVHAQVPTPYVMEDRIRIFYACRNNGKAFVAYFDLAKDLKTILKVHEKPVLEHGKPGMFEADGVMPSCILPMGNELWLYYIGWSELKNTARYQNEIGIAVSKDNGETFDRMFKGPIMGRSKMEPGLAVMPFVMKDGDRFKMWYQSGTGWHFINDQYEPTYVIKYAESDDGVEWGRHQKQCIESSYPLEAFSRPSLVLQGGVFKMWFCSRDSEDYRGGFGSYRIDYAESKDGINFYRDYGEIELGKEEWDSKMQAYPYVIELDGKLVMFYNGNLFGQTGIGVAIWG